MRMKNNCTCVIEKITDIGSTILVGTFTPKPRKHCNFRALCVITHYTYLIFPDRYAATQDDTLKPYPIYGVTIAEVEVDMLTGQHMIRRVDLMEDTGMSLNPELDIGQVEGAFVMGIGYWTSEDLVYDPKTGVLTNQRTWVRGFY